MALNTLQGKPMLPSLGNNGQESKSGIEPKSDHERDDALLSVKNLDGSVTVLLGARGTGKTELAYRLAKFYGRPTYAISPQQVPPSWIHRVTLENMFQEVKPRSTLIADDLPAYASNRDYNEGLVQALEKVIPMARHESTPDHPIGEIHLIFCSQSAAQADKYILDCDLALFKPLGLLIGGVERPHIAKIYREFVDPEFDGKDMDWIRKHAYIFSRTWRGIIEFHKT